MVEIVEINEFTQLSITNGNYKFLITGISYFRPIYARLARNWTNLTLLEMSFLA